MEYEMGDEEGMDKDNKTSQGAKGQNKGQQNKNKSQNNNQGGEGRGAFISSAATGLRDMLAADFPHQVGHHANGDDGLNGVPPLVRATACRTATPFRRRRTSGQHDE